MPRDRSAPDAPCAVEGCPNPRHVTKGGTRMTRCLQHYKEGYQKPSGYVPTTSRRRELPTPNTVQVLVLDWQTEQVLHITGIVDCSEPLPATYGDVLKQIAHASRDGVFVAYIRAYREEDLK